MTGIILMGGITGRLIKPGYFRSLFYYHAIGMVALWIGFFIVLLLPQRGEWVVGGWDPGVYLNQGVLVSQQGSFYPEALPCYKNLSEEAFAAFTRGRGNYIEAFPGCRQTRITGHFVYTFSG